MNKVSKRIRVIVGVVLVIGILMGLLSLAGYVARRNTHSARCKRRLYYKTDYVQLLAACQSVITNRASYAELYPHWQPRWADYESAKARYPDLRELPDPSVTYLFPSATGSWPQALLDIQSQGLVVTDSRLFACFVHSPPCAHFGIAAFLDETNITDIDAFWDNMEKYDGALLAPTNKAWVKIIDHLWYYDIDGFWLGDGADREKVVSIFREQVAKQKEKRTKE